MRIAISGAPSQGKTLLTENFLNNWSNYTLFATPFDVNKDLNKKNQWDHLQLTLNAVNNKSRTANNLYRGTPLDNLVFSLWANEKGIGDIDDDFIKKCIPLVKEGSKYIDIYFYTVITKVALVQTGAASDPEVMERIKEIDNIYKAIAAGLINGNCPFMDPEDRPPVIEIFGSPLERIEMVKLYLNKDGGLYDDGNTVFSNENLDLMEQVLREQREVAEVEKMEQQVKNTVSIFNEKDFKTEVKPKKS